MGRTRRGAAVAAPPGRAAKAEGRPSGREPRAAIAPTPGADPRPPRPRPRPPPCSPLLTSSPDGSALPPPGQISAAHSPRGGTQEPQPRTPSPPAARRPPASPGVPASARGSPSRAAVLRSNQAALPPAPPLLSTSVLPPSLPRSRLSAHLSPRPAPPLSTPPSPPTGGHGKQPANRKKGSAPPSPPLASSTAHLEGTNKDERVRSDLPVNQPASSKEAGIRVSFPAPFPEGVTTSF